MLTVRMWCEGFSGDWGAAGISDALYTISNDMQRIQSLLPELSPQDRWGADVKQWQHTERAQSVHCLLCPSWGAR